MTTSIKPSGQCYSADLALIKAYGLHEAFLIHHFQHWIRVNKKNKNNLHDGRTWTYQTMQYIADHFEFLTYEQVKYAIENLEKLEVIIKGNYNQSSFDKTTWYAFVHEEIYVPDLPQKSNNQYERENSPSIGKIPLSTGKIPSSIPDKAETTDNPETKGNVLDNVDTLPFESAKGRQCKFPLKKEQQHLLVRLKALDLGCDDETLKIIIRSNPEKKIADAINHMQIEISKGTHFKKSRIAFFRFLLKGNVSVISERATKNKNEAIRLKDSLKWNSLIISEKFCSCEITGKEVPYDIEWQQFGKMLKQVYDLNKNY